MASNITSKFVKQAICSSNTYRRQLLANTNNVLITSIHKGNQNKRFLATTSIMLKSYKVPLPALSPTMEAGTIVSWEKKEGDKLNDGDLLAEIETDKATMGFETPEEGYLAKVVIPAGTKNVPLGKILCVIVDSEAEIEEFKNYTGEGDSIKEAAPPNPSQDPTPATKPQQQAQPAAPHKSSTVTPQPQTLSPAPIQPPSASLAGQRVFASPLAKKLARENNTPLPQTGSGSGGRVVANDLLQLISSKAPASASTQVGLAANTNLQSDFVDIPLTSMRQTIAKRLTQSKQAIPHYYLTVNLNVDELLKLRQLSNTLLAKEEIKLSVNDFIIKAAAIACKQVPEVNSSWNETFIRQFNNVDVCVAVSTDAGLITPIVFDAGNKGIKQISTDIKSLASKARAGKLQPAEFQGGTFTISNLGMFNIDHFTAVINPPQAAILAVGSTQKTIVPSTDDSQQFTVVNTMNVTLSCDHRVVDGAVGAKWLIVFRQLIEKPFTMLL